jgi:hypothetical protein
LIGFIGQTCVGWARVDLPSFLAVTRLSSFLLSLWSAIRIIAHERPGAIILIALQRHGAIILIALQRHGAIILIALQRLEES